MTARLAETLGRPLRILEVGGGTGGTTAALLPRLGAACGEYLFTDVSPFFAVRARERFGETPGFAAQALDLEREPATQGLAGRRFDLVVAANVLHATRDLGRTLAHVRQVLEPGGLLLLLEVTRPTGWVDVSFGLTEGWWLFDDAPRRRADSPLLGAAEWLACLKAHGFDEAAALPDDPAALQALVVARSQAQPLTPRAAGRWLILADAGGMGASLAQRLVEGGAAAVSARAGACFAARPDGGLDANPSSVEDLRGVVAEARRRLGGLDGVVSLWPLDAVAGPQAALDAIARDQLSATAGALHLVQALAGVPDGAPPRLWLVTRGAQAAEAGDTVPAPTQATVWGLGGSVALEHPEFQCRRIDLAPDPVDGEADLLARELLAADGEEQVALRRSGRLAARLARLRPPRRPPSARPTGWTPRAAGRSMA